MSSSLLRRFLVCAVLTLAPMIVVSAFAQPAPGAPELPRGVAAHWHGGKVLTRASSLTVIDIAGSNHIEFPAWAAVDPQGGIRLDGTQKEGVRLTQRHPASPDFQLGVDINPDLDGPEHQTLVYLYGFCELRYRQSRGELTLNVWQISRDEPGKQVITSVRRSLSAGKWSRVQVVMSGDTARLVVDGVADEAPLAGTWEFLPANVPVFIGFGGTDRAFRGRFNHLYFADPR